MNERPPDTEQEVEPQTGNSGASASEGGKSRRYRWSGTTGDPAGNRDDREPAAEKGASKARSSVVRQPPEKGATKASSSVDREPAEEGAPRAESPDGRRRWRIAVAVAVPVLMVAAIVLSMRGNQPEAPAGDDPLVRYCATVVERDSIRLPNPAESGSEEVQNLVPVVAGRLVLLTEKLLEVAPDDAKPGLRRQEEAYRALVRSRDAAGFRSAELLASRNQVNEIDVEACKLDRVEFAAAEFSYTGVPEQVGHGKASLQMVNEGQEAHEFVLYRRKEDFGGDFTRILRRDSQDEEATPVASGYAAPGARSNVVADLVVGDYVMVCMMRTGNEAHWQKGMITELTVQ